MTNELPNKLYYSISEVARHTDVKAHVLRYWESEFPTLRPKKTRSGARRYRQKDIDEVLAIKHLLYDEGFKIAGAKRVRREARRGAAEPKTETKAAPQMAMTFDGLDDRQRLEAIRDELQEVLKMIRALGAEQAAEKPKARKANG